MTPFEAAAIVAAMQVRGHVFAAPPAPKKPKYVRTVHNLQNIEKLAAILSSRMGYLMHVERMSYEEARAIAGPNSGAGPSTWKRVEVLLGVTAPGAQKSAADPLHV